MRTFKELFLGMLIGGSIGAFLFKTKHGKRIQKEILSKYKHLSSKAHHLLQKEMKRVHHYTVRKKRKSK